MKLTEPILFAATKDPERARHFYEDVLGLTFVSDGPHALVFKSGEITLRVQKVEEVVAAPYTLLGWRVSDLQGKIRELKSRGVRFEIYPGLNQDGEGVWQTPAGALVAWFKDPDGNTLSLVQPTM
jgi:catechol 2,3-dioxygenase-like lactoylglutathione lyase family enzyme